MPRPEEPVYGTVIFDCDGVIFDSNRAKTAAFATVATEAGYEHASVDAFAQWQSRNFGLSRYRAFDELVGGRFGDPLGDAPDTEVLLARFASEVEAIYATAPFTDGFPDILNRLRGHRLFVASGSKQDELRAAMRTRGIAHHFDGIFGSPTAKGDIVRSILSDVRAADPSTVAVLVGDAHADADAAQANGIDFIFLAAYSTVADSMTVRAASEGFPVVETLRSIFPVSDPSRGALNDV